MRPEVYEAKCYEANAECYTRPRPEWIIMLMIDIDNHSKYDWFKQN